jgi:hypothetical protein
MLFGTLVHMPLWLVGSDGSRRAERGEASVGQEAYYEQQVAAGADDYYAGRGESPGIWAGRGAAELDLVGVVGDGDLGTLTSRRRPGQRADAANARAGADDHGAHA